MSKDMFCVKATISLLMCVVQPSKVKIMCGKEATSSQVHTLILILKKVDIDTVYIRSYVS